MSRNSDILFMTEYIQNVLYFATVRQGKVLKQTNDTHYFSIDDELIYENYYSDFGPLNIGCVYKYCKILNEKLKLYLNKQCIVHYTSIDPKKKANAAFLLGSYGVLYLSLSPKDALKPLLIYGQSYRPFQDATQGDSAYTISLMDCLQGLTKARDLGFFNFQDFNYEEYERLDKIQGGDLNWIVPGKFLAFIGPVDYSVSLYHPPEMYIDYFLENNVKIVIRLNKKFYDGNVFSNIGITHYNLFFPDGSCPPRHILLRFLQISEESEDAIAVHCKAGLGRTGSLIGCYLIKHYRLTAHEAIAWMRICRPGSVIGHQQGWLEQLEPWLIKQGNFYRRRNSHDANKMPTHEFGIYSKVERVHRQRPIVLSKSPSPLPPIHRQTRSEVSSPPRPQISKTREETSENDEDEIFIAECDLTVKSTEPMTQMKGCIIKYPNNKEENHSQDDEVNIPLWKRYLCCKPCAKACNDKLWMLAVRCAKLTPNNCCLTKCCFLLDMAASSKTTETAPYEWNEKINASLKVPHKGISRETSGIASRRGSGAGEPRNIRSSSRSNMMKLQGRPVNKSLDPHEKHVSGQCLVPTTTTPVAKTLNDARKLLMRSTAYNEQRAKQLNSSIIVKPQYSFRVTNTFGEQDVRDNITNFTSSAFNTVSKSPLQSQQRRRLGRSPSPPARKAGEQSRATNTPFTTETFKIHDSKSNLKEALSRLKLSAPRDGSIGAASLGARRDAPTDHRRAPSVRSDERPLATQGDMLNSIKFQRGLRDTITAEKHGNKFNDKNSTTSKDKSSIRNENTKTSGSTGPRLPFSNEQRGRPTPTPRGFFNAPRPSSPKGRRSPHPSFY